jgi:1-phosphofructokinase family hexose kinase
MIVSLALSPSLDITYEVPALRHRDITRPTAVTRVAGGKSLNVARVAHALGADVRVVAALGGHTGAWITEMLTAALVDVDVVQLSAPTRICSAIVEAGENPSSTDLYEPATALSPMEWQRFADAALAVRYRPGTWVVVAGSVPSGVQPQDVVALVQALCRSGARLAVDSSGEGLHVLAGHADLLKINRVEAAELLGAEQRDAEAAASRLAALYDCDAVVTDGVRGGFAVIGGADCPLEPPQTVGRYPAGSGDAFLGGLLAGLDSGLEPPKALAQARDAAERNACVPGQGVLGPLGAAG